MSRQRLCDDGGLLVDGKSRLPSDPCEYYREPVHALCGCNRLRCSRCQAWVRGGPPGLAVKSGASADLAALHASDRWADLPFIGAQDDVRLYSCLCTTWHAWNNASVINEHEDPWDPDVPWRCQGHPVPDLPIDLGELTIGIDTSWADLVDRILHGACPRPLELQAYSQREGPSSWLRWLYAYLAGLPATDALSRALADRNDDADPQVVGRVLSFFTAFPRAEGVEALISRAEDAVERVAVGYPVPEQYTSPTLWDVLVARLEQPTRHPDPLDGRVADLFREVLLVPLASLSHEDLGPTDRVTLKREEMRREGWDVDGDSAKQTLAEYAHANEAERTDVVANALEQFSTAFNNADLRLWIAENIVAIDAAARGRWRPLMNLLTDWYQKPELGYLIVIAGTRLIQSGAAGSTELREWIDSRRAYGWVDPAWVLPLQSLLDKKSKLH